MKISHRLLRNAEPCPDWSAARGLRRGCKWIACFLIIPTLGCQSPGATTPMSPAGADSTDQLRCAAVDRPDQQFEPEASLQAAADILPAALLAGTHHDVRPDVVARGFVNYYVIESDFGPFLAASDGEVAERIREIDAIGELRRLSKSAVIADSATHAAKRGYIAAKQVIDKPVETARGIPQGLVRLFRRSKRQAEDAYEKVSEWYEGDDEKRSEAPEADRPARDRGITKDKIRNAADLGIDEGQDYLRSSLGFNRERRRLAQQLGIDPYSRNATLRHELSSMAWTATAGSFAANLILPDVPAPVGLLQSTRELVWNTHPTDLRIRNEDALRAMNIESDRLAKFLANELFTLTDQTRFVQALERLHGVAGRNVLLSSASQVQSSEETRYSVRRAELLAVYHERRARIEKLFGDKHGQVTARDTAGRFILALPLDYLNWSGPAYEMTTAARAALTAHAQNAVAEIWIEGTASARAHREISRFGWGIQERAFALLGNGPRNAG